MFSLYETIRMSVTVLNIYVYSPQKQIKTTENIDNDKKKL